MTHDDEPQVDRARLEELLCNHLPRLEAFVRVKAGGVVTERESVSDIVQSVCREVLAEHGRFEDQGEEAFRGWLFLMAARKIVDRHRFHRRAARDPGREVAAPATSEAEASRLLDGYASICTPSRAVGAREELERIESALHRLPEPQREAVAMSRLMGLSYAETGELLGRSESAVRGLVARGLATLSAQLVDG